MKYPILYDVTEELFEGFGVAVLRDATNIVTNHKLNSEMTLEFSTPMNSEGSEEIIPERFVKVDQNVYIIKKVDKKRNQNNKKMIDVFCEHIFFELLDEFIPYDENAYIGKTPQMIMDALIGTQIDTKTRFYADATRLGGSLVDVHIDKGNPISAINQFIEQLKCEFLVDGTPDATGKFKITFYTKGNSGEYGGLQFRYQKNVKSITKTIDSTSVVTRLYPFGEKDLTIAAATQNTTGEHYIDADNINDYIKPKKAHKSFDVSDVEDKDKPDRLYTLAKEYLEGAKLPKVTYEIDAVSLESLEGYDDSESFNIGDHVMVIDDELGIDYVEAQIVEVEKHPLDPRNNRVMLANFIPGLGDYFDKLEETRTLVNDFLFNKKIPTSWLDGIIDAKQNRILNQIGEYEVENLPDQGMMFISDDSAMWLSPDGFAIANSKNAEGEFEFRSFGDGRGFTADELISGSLLTSKIDVVSEAYIDPKTGDYVRDKQTGEIMYKRIHHDSDGMHVFGIDPIDHVGDERVTVGRWLAGDNPNDPADYEYGMKVGDGAIIIEGSAGKKPLNSEHIQTIEDLEQNLGEVIGFVADGKIAVHERYDIRKDMIQQFGKLEYVRNAGEIPGPYPLADLKEGDLRNTILEAERRTDSNVDLSVELTTVKDAYNILHDYLYNKVIDPVFVWDITEYDPKKVIDLAANGTTVQEWENKWSDYYLALIDLKNKINQGYLKEGSKYNNVRIDTEDGLTATRDDDLVRTRMNATVGITIERRDDTTQDWDAPPSTDPNMYKQMWHDTYGNLNLKGNINMDGGSIDWNNVNNPPSTSADGVIKGNTIPKDQNDGRLWMDTRNGEYILRRYNATDNIWEPVSTHIDAQGLITQDITASKIISGTIGTDNLTAGGISVVNDVGDTTLNIDSNGNITLQGNIVWSKTNTPTPEQVGAEKEIYRGISAPSSPTVDMLWLDTSTTPHIMKKYTGTSWIEVGSGETITKQDTAPDNPTDGMLWIDTSNTIEELYRWDSSISEWIKVGNAQGETILRGNGYPSMNGSYNGQLYLDESTSPSAFYRWNGSSWLKVTPTTATEVNAVVDHWQNVLDSLTNNGTFKGIYYDSTENNLLINADYIKTGVISADLIKGGTITTSTIDVASNARVGDVLNIGSDAQSIDDPTRYLKFNNGANIRVDMWGAGEPYMHQTARRTYFEGEEYYMGKTMNSDNVDYAVFHNYADTTFYNKVTFKGEIVNTNFTPTFG